MLRIHRNACEGLEKPSKSLDAKFRRLQLFKRFTWATGLPAVLVLKASPAVSPDWLTAVLIALFIVAWIVSALATRPLAAERRKYNLLLKAGSDTTTRRLDGQLQKLFILYLRSFSDESPVVREGKREVDEREPEDTIMKALVSQAAVIGVANRDDVSGSSRLSTIYFSTADWKEGVQKLVTLASLVWVYLTQLTPGVEQELEIVRGRSALSKTLVLAQGEEIAARLEENGFSVIREAEVWKRAQSEQAAGATPEESPLLFARALIETREVSERIAVGAALEALWHVDTPLEMLNRRLGRD